MKGDLPEKGAIIQRDGETYAIAPHIPGGFIRTEQFAALVDTAEKYGVKAMKLTSGQRLVLLGLEEEQLDPLWRELEMSIGYAIGLCVRMVKFCPGTTHCRHAKQDAVGLGLKLDELYHGYPLPAKFKIGVAGCEYSCTAPLFKEIGLRGMPEGWTLTAGGNCGARPRFGDEIATGLTDDQVLPLVERIIEFSRCCQEHGKMRLGRIIEKIGLDRFIKQAGL